MNVVSIHYHSTHDYKYFSLILAPNNVSAIRLVNTLQDTLTDIQLHKIMILINLFWYPKQ